MKTSYNVTAQTEKEVKNKPFSAVRDENMYRGLYRPSAAFNLFSRFLTTKR